MDHAMPDRDHPAALQRAVEPADDLAERGGVKNFSVLVSHVLVPPAIRAVMERRPALQVVATSHSPFLFEQVRGAEVRVMALNAEGHACVQPLTAHPEYDRWARSMSTGEVWANVGEAWVC
jgi:hypothetical protein